MFDPGQRRKAQRSGRERGCWVYISAETLQAAGYGPDQPVPFYRTWGGKGGSVVIRLYREQ